MIRKAISYGKTKRVTVLEFGSGTIQIIPSKGFMHNSILCKQSKYRKVGDKISAKKLNNSDDFKPQVVLAFENIESVDVLLESLSEMRTYFLEKE